MLEHFETLPSQESDGKEGGDWLVRDLFVFIDQRLLEWSAPPDPVGKPTYCSVKDPGKRRQIGRFISV